MRIAMVLEQMQSIGGTTTHVASLCRHLSGGGHEVHLICLGSVNPTLDLGGTITHSAGPLPHNILDGHLTAAHLVQAVLDITKRHRIDVLHAHYPCAMLAGAVNKAINGTPYLITLHGYELPSFLLRDFQFYAARLGLMLASFIISVSRALAQQFISVMGKPSAPLYIIPDGVDFPEAHVRHRAHIRDELGLGSSFVFIFVGRLSIEKGLRELLEAYRKLSIERPDCLLLIIGDGQLRAEIERYIESHDIKQRVRLLGRVPHSQVLDYLAAADALVLPSYAEGLGTVLVEAFAAGIPAIGAAVGGIPEVIVSGSNGLLVPPRDATALYEAMKLLVSNEEYYQRLRREASNTAQHYSWRRLQGQVEELYVRSVNMPDTTKEQAKEKLAQIYDFSGGTPWDSEIKGD